MGLRIPFPKPKAGREYQKAMSVSPLLLRVDGHGRESRADLLQNHQTMKHLINRLQDACSMRLENPGSPASSLEFRMGGLHTRLFRLELMLF